MDSWLEEMKAWGKETTAYEEATEACLESKKLPSVAVGSVAVIEEVLTEEAAVKTARTLKKRYGDLCLVDS
jgi:hypothetical protein